MSIKKHIGETPFRDAISVASFFTVIICLNIYIIIPLALRDIDSFWIWPLGILSLIIWCVLGAFGAALINAIFDKLMMNATDDERSRNAMIGSLFGLMVVGIALAMYIGIE